MKEHGVDWRTRYGDRLVTADQAVRAIASGDRVVAGQACGEPAVLLRAMVANASRFRDVEIVHMMPGGAAAYCRPEMAQHFRLNTVFVDAVSRQAVADGRADFTPVFFSAIPDLLRGSLRADVALVNVSPPDRHGFCSFGVSVDYSKAAAEAARTVIGQVNARMPRTHGQSFIHLRDLDVIVEVDEAIIELFPAKLDDVELSIGRHCASLVRDGDTLQVGIGAIPDAVLMSLKDKNDLGIHSEMLSEGLVDLMESGVITNQRKNFHTGRSVATFAMGTQRLYDYIDDNPAVEMAPVDFVNDPRVIAQNDNMVSINSCIQVDLTGQVVASSIGPLQISGVGGQVDFVRGAAMSRGGRTIMAMSSTAQYGIVSKIVPFIDEGAAVTTSRCEVDYVVTEHGVAQLRGRTLRARARELIEVAHPRFRGRLVAEYEKRFHERLRVPAGRR